VKLPDTPRPGSPFPPSIWFRQAVDYLRALTDRVARLEGGTAPRSGPIRRARLAPFTLTGIIETEPAAAKIRIHPGLVNNSIPKIVSVSLVAVPAPTITVTGSSGIIYLKATVDDAGVITDLIAANVAGDEEDLPEDTATDKHRLVGTWTAASGAFTSVVSLLDRNQNLYLCGGTAIWEIA
jgi:hypothetical protein